MTVMRLGRQALEAPGFPVGNVHVMTDLTQKPEGE